MDIGIDMDGMNMNGIYMDMGEKKIIEQGIMITIAQREWMRWIRTGKGTKDEDI